MSEKRLIDANALIDYIDEGYLSNPLQLCFSEHDVVNMVNGRPTVDAVEVVHGRWVPINTVHERRLQCNQCKHYVDAGTDRNYCPNCGAKMDGERKDNG